MPSTKKSKSKKKFSSSTGSRSGNPPKKAFRCTICSYFTFVKARFTKHVKYHSMPFIKCDHCDFKTPYKWNLDRHYKNHNGEGSLKCPLCNFTCDIKQSLTVHIQNHHTDVPENIGDLIRQTLGYSDVPYLLKQEKEAKNNSRSSAASPKRRNSTSPLRNAMTPAPKRLKSEPPAATAATTNVSISSNKSLFTKKFYKCRSCQFNALSESALDQHVTEAHPDVPKRRTSVPSSLVSTQLGKPMPSLIPIPSKSNLTNAKDSGPPTLKAETPFNNVISDEELERQERFREKTEFLEYFSLKPKMSSLIDHGIKNQDDQQKSTTSVSSSNLQLKRRRTSFFEKLTQKLVANSKSDTESLVGGSSSSITITSNSTRCQYCRHRCKSSVDLISHLGQCASAKQFLDEENVNHEEEEPDESANLSDGRSNSDSNKVFVWNLSTKESASKSAASSDQEDFTGFENSSGITSMHFKEHNNADKLVDNGSTTTKSRKVYKCPQQNCGFWATTASRFHVHIVGHYNLKPFECSQCSYRSNWRWDITKHIKLKTMRDPSHSKAKVLLTHESGQRNYRKYDRYLMPMDVKYSADSKLPDCSTVASKRPDVELSPAVVAPTPPSSQAIGNGKSAKQSLKMPKLTKAPSASRQTSPIMQDCRKISKMETTLPAMAPPTLRPIISISPLNPFRTSPGSRSFVERSMLAGGEILQNMNMDSLGKEITVTPIRGQFSKEQNDALENLSDPKSVLWKCKKCSFKNGNKDLVINHINQIHKPKNGEFVSILNQNNLVPVDDNDESDSENEFGSIQKLSFGLFNDLPSIKVDKRYSCVYCNLVLPSRRDLRIHMKIHGSELNVDDSSNLSFEGGVIFPEEVHTKPRGQISSADGLPYKKYHCKECPYVTDSKGQFVYHKRFHMPSDDAPFKCSKCSYHVSHKHLLHQHIRVHYPLPGHSLSDDMEIIPQDEHMGVEYNTMDLGESEENHPTVLVWKGNRPYKMFRCRFCPQVYGELDDLMDHENEHDNNDTNEFDNCYPPPEDEAINLCLNSRRDSWEDRSTSLLKSNFPKDNLSNVVPKFNSTSQEQFNTAHPNSKSVLYLCDECPARFFYERELRIHNTFHVKMSEFRCLLCSYSARQEIPHLMSHMKVHGEEYQLKTRILLGKYPQASSTNYGSTDIPAPFRVPITITPTQPSKQSFSSSTSQLSKLLTSSKDPSINCRNCPARFNTMASFVQHMNNHGRNSIFTCRHCDYGTDSANNLTLHSILHAGSEITIEPEVNQFPFQFSTSTVVSQSQGSVTTKSSQKKSINQPRKESPLNSYKSPTTTNLPISKPKEELYQGNPEFVYPTYVKNGRIKSKRYKCCKCPSAFEKRDQYKVHMGLHGSNQRYKCTVCDYSVTYYANFIQHLKKHENQTNVSPHQLIAKPLSKVSKKTAPKSSAVSVKPKSPQPSAPVLLKIPKANSRLSTDSLESLDLSQKSSVESQKCIFCNFEAGDKDALKDHIRLHFNSKRINENLPDVHMYIENSNTVTVSKVDADSHMKGRHSTDVELEQPSDETDEEDYEMYVKKTINRSFNKRQKVPYRYSADIPVPDLIKSENEASE